MSQANDGKGRVLVIDDEVDLLVSCRKILKRLGYDVTVSERAANGIEVVRSGEADVVLVDLKMPGMGGIEALSQMKEARPEVPVVIITAFASVQTAVEAIKAGAFDYLAKPFSADQLEVAVRRAVEHHHLLQENQELKTRVSSPGGVGSLRGDSDAMARVFDLIRKVSRTDASVLIVGESGTGKELAAQAIHLLSPRNDREFVPVDCAALPGNLIESELFGYEKGAFTGAHAQRDGLLKLADGGTLFLDEIGELDVSIQVKLLRVLQERQYRRVGGSDMLEVDVRVCAATNRNLSEEIQAGRFREDLYHRINVVRLEMPPLRDRAGDLRLLVDHFLRKFTPPGEAVPHVGPDVWALLESYTWPGNVRELQNVIHRAVSLCEGAEVQLEDLPESLTRGKFSERPTVDKTLPYKEAKARWLEPFEREYLIDLLRRNEGNVTYAAKEARIDRKSIQRMMKKHRIRVEDVLS